MTMLGRLGLIALCAGGTAGCAGLPLSSFDAYPVYDNPVNPTPVPGYRLECTTTVGPTLLLLNGTTAGCQQVIVPPAPVLSTRG